MATNDGEGLIRHMTSKLDGKLSRQIFNEYKDRLREIEHLLERRQRFATLRDDGRTIETLLALSIFNRRVIANFDAVIKFRTTLNSYGERVDLKMGGREMNKDEANKVERVTRAYRFLLAKYEIPAWVLSYESTVQFLRHLQDLKRGSLPQQDKENE